MEIDTKQIHQYEMVIKGMKYPQLVSPRAVNAISDWLVSRLEQLGVESPQIYTRLLLSLLQSSVQVNDPIEFSNLEAFFANRKGGHKRFHLPSDTETLKKLNAVHCLREIVSNEHETTTIQKLVDELCEKLKDIEKQTQNLNDEERFLIETHLNTDSLLKTHTQLQHPTSSNKSNNNTHHHPRHHQQQHIHHHPQQQQQVTQVCNDPKSDAFSTDSKRHNLLGTTTTSDALNDLDNDPKNRYFRAFPALSKEMEDSFRVWRRNAKSLTWPIVGRSIAADNQNNSSASLSSSSASSVSTEKSVETKLKGVVGHQVEKKVNSDFSGNTCSGNIDGIDVKQKHQGAAPASVKKKSKRRRNQALCKGKITQTIRKVSVGTTSNFLGVHKYHQYTQHRNSSPAWDTDFKGCWEMGPDLIKEFISSQNGNKRDLNNSECMGDNEDEVNNHVDATQPYTEEGGVDYVDEDYDDNTLAAVSELTMDNFNPKRLYQREGHAQKSVAFGDTVLIGKFACDNTLDETADYVDPLDFQQFKAKFNSSVEALWKDAEITPTIRSQQSTITPQTGDKSLTEHNSLGGGMSSNYYATSTSLNTIAPFKQDLPNFWSNYQQLHNDRFNNKLSTTTSTSSMANSSDYFSMPSNLDDFDKSVGAVRRTNDTGASQGVHTPSFNVFLQNSIWSTSADCVDAIGTSSVATAADTNDSFLFKVWHSNKKLNQLDVGNAVNCEKMHTIEVDNDGVNKDSSSLMVNNPNIGANVQFSSYQNLKWSEGINAGPPYGSLRTHSNVSHHNETESLHNISSLRADNNYASFSSVTSISGATWQAPTYGQNAQPDLRSWCASNPMSLTEMYGKDVCDSIVNQSPVEENKLNQSEIAMSPAVTLPNHCANASGFVAYSRIKQCGIVQPQIKPLQTSSTARLPKDFFRSSEEENLLTSERTHFHPIDGFVDGYTFDISNTLDTIEFERTSSGLMRYESEEYFEYTRNDIYMADEEEAPNSTNLLKYIKKADEDKSNMFVIKFRVKRSGEIACQTEEHDFQLAAAKMVEIPNALGAFPPSFEVNNMFHNTFSLSRQANNEAIMAAVTKAVAAAAKAAAENHLSSNHFCWLPITNINTNTIASDSCNNTREDNSVWRPDNFIGDEVDFCEIGNSAIAQQQQLAQNWSMHEVEKQCHQRRCLTQQQEEQDINEKFLITSDVERSEENSLDNTSLHTLWGMCAVCNDCEYGKSMPANRLLRDELQQEADEIMSDLRYMQDLYIGESDVLNNTKEAQSTDEKELTTESKMFDSFSKDMDINSIKNPWNMNIRENAGHEHDRVQVSMLQKVNQLIEDLLKPENTGKLPMDTVKYDKIIKQTQLNNVWNLQADQDKTENLWQFGNHEDNNIWQHKPLKEKQFEAKISKNNDAFEKPMKLLRQVGDSFLSEDTQYSNGINWEHDNLAKIWQHSTPTIMQLEETLIKHEPHETPTIIDEKLLMEDQEESVEGCQKLVEEKNLKNVQNTSDLTSPSTLPFDTYERVQQFLNNSAAKMKLIANRKRRHSASQNFYQQQHLHYSNSSNSNNNNNNSITDLNAYKQNLNETITADKEQEQHNQLEVTSYNNTTPKSCMNMEEQLSKQTIITCKYWTTATNGTQSSLDSAAAAMMLLAVATDEEDNANDMLTTATAENFDQEDVVLDENIFGNTFSCLVDKNASILKHVTMMTRPLTR